MRRRPSSRLKQANLSCLRSVIYLLEFFLAGLVKTWLLQMCFFDARCSPAITPAVLFKNLFSLFNGTFFCYILIECKFVRKHNLALLMVGGLRVVLRRGWVREGEYGGDICVCLSVCAGWRQYADGLTLWFSEGVKARQVSLIECENSWVSRAVFPHSSMEVTISISSRL